jgi:peptidoglycan-N-acetylglucosamine deacetylase
MEGFNIYKTPAWGVVDPSAEELIAYIEKAKGKGTIAIFMFHSVGGGYLNVGADEHRELLKYLNEHRKEYYTGTFMEVMEYIKANL